MTPAVKRDVAAREILDAEDMVDVVVLRSRNYWVGDFIEKFGELVD